MQHKIYIRLASPRENVQICPERAPNIYTPGQIITNQKEFMRGHGTYEDDGLLKSSVAGIQERVNNLISIRPLKSRYNGEIGDVVVGRITELQQKRWKINTNSRLDSILLISSVNLPGGELRRRSEEDEHMMRKYLQEGDLISAEVQNVHSDGTLSLHTRSLKYGKLGQGILVKVFPSLIKRCKTHFHNETSIGISLILGMNGFIWISPLMESDEENCGGNAGGFVQNLDEVIATNVRQGMARTRNCILALAEHKVMLYDTSIWYAHEWSKKYTVAELLLPDVIQDVAISTQLHLISLGND